MKLGEPILKQFNTEASDVIEKAIFRTVRETIRSSGETFYASDQSSGNFGLFALDLVLTGASAFLASVS